MDAAGAYSAVVGIDFGTGGFAIAVGYKAKSGNVYVLDLGTKSGPVKKNRAAILARRDTDRSALEFVSIGFDAIVDFSETEGEDALLFESAKMDLYEQSSGRAQTKAVNGSRAPAVEVIQMALTEIRRIALMQFAHVSGRVSPTEGEVRWVLTVPAIWLESSKQIMRCAAIQAGIPDADLILALEPEAASMACRQGPAPDLQSHPLDPGSSYMIVDAGAGTVDITVHQLDTNGNNLADVIAPRGGPFGSRQVDMQFKVLLDTIFGADMMLAFCEGYPSAFMDIMSSFEAIKCRTDLGSKKKLVQVTLGAKFLFFVNNGDGEVPDRKLPPGININYRFAYMELSTPAIRALFAHSLQSISDLIAGILDDENVVSTCKTLYLVGGYGACPFLKETIESVLEEKCPLIQVFRPNDPLTAVVRGAVLYGQFPDALSSRMCQKTIGVAVSVPFDPVDHAGQTPQLIDGSEWCTTMLDVLVRAGQRVQCTKEMVHTYSPIGPGQRHSVIRLYQSSTPTAGFINDDGVDCVGELVVINPPENCTISVQLQFGSTEMKASAISEDGRPVECTLDFCNVARTRPKSLLSVDVCFVMDCTGSMSSLINAAKEHLLAIAKNVRDNVTERDDVICDLRFAFVAYRDFCDHDHLASIDFTSDFAKVREFIAGQKASGGGDSPEDLLGGLSAALELKWAAKNRFVILTADAPCHGREYGSCSDDTYPDGNPDGLTPEGVLEAYRSLDLKVMFTEMNRSTNLMLEKFGAIYPIKRIDMSTKNCITQFGTTLTSEIVGHILRVDEHGE